MGDSTRDLITKLKVVSIDNYDVKTDTVAVSSGDMLRIITELATLRHKVALTTQLAGFTEIKPDHPTR